MNDPTEPDRIRPPGVSDKQSIAIDALVSGALQWEAAEKAGVQRTTVTAWCNHHIAFIAERNQRRQDRVEAAGEQLQETLCAALVHLGEKVREGDTGAAVTIVKAVGVGHLLDAARPGPTTPMGVHQDLAADLKSDLVGEMFVSEEISWMVERDSDASAD
jgi:hypothetical protein